MSELPPERMATVDLSRLTTGTGQVDEGALVAQREARELISCLFVCVKLAFLYDLKNDALGPPCHRMADVANRIREREAGIAALQFLGDGVYVNKMLVKVDAGSFEQGQYLFGVWTKLGVSEIAAMAETTAHDWLSFLAAFKLVIGPEGDPARFRQTTFDKIRLREVQASGTAAESMVVTERFRALRTYAICAVTIKEQIHKLHQGKAPEAAKVKRAIQDLIAVATDSEALLLSLVSLKRHKKELAYHLTNCVVLSVVIGKRLDLTRNVLCELGMHAAFHDLGKSFLADAEGREAEKQIASTTVRKLVQAGVGHQAMLLRVVVANEIRRSVKDDGQSGEYFAFPQCGASRIVAVAHAYDLLTTPRDKGPCLLPDEALRVLLCEADRRYDAVAVKVFANAVGVFPVGSVVALSTGETAIVIEAPRDPARASRPRIKIVRDASGDLGDGFVVDLAAHSDGPERKILQCVDPEEEALNPPAFLLS
jgi:hypothetical protein